MKSARVAATLLLAASIVGCRHAETAQTAAPAPAATQPASEMPPYRQSPAQLDAFLKAHARDAGTVGERAVAIARRNVGQPYDMYLLGESPFEHVDDQPVFCLEKSDCVVAVEHELAMALSPDFPSFLRMLQRIRYHDGAIGVRTRNHYTEADWNVSNAWLVEDVTRRIAGDKAKTYPLRINRQAFFKERYKIDVDVPVQTMTVAYVRDDSLDAIKGQLRTGDLFNSIKGNAAGGAYASHVGLIEVAADGSVHFLHSNELEGELSDETMEHFVAKTLAHEAKKATTQPTIDRHKGFTFLRTRDDALARLRAIDGDATPRVTVPADSAISFDAFVARTLPNVAH